MKKKKMRTTNLRVDIRKLLDTNLYIFKENLKVVANCASELISRDRLEPQHGSRENQPDTRDEE